MSVRKVSSDMFIVNIARLVQSATFILQNFNDSEAFFSYVPSSQFIALFLLTTTLNNFRADSRLHFLTGAKVIKAAYGFKRSVASRTKPETLNTEAVNFSLSVCFIEALDIAIWSCLLKIRHGHTFKVTVLVLSRCDSLFLQIEIPTHIKTSRHGLEHQITIKLASINPNN